MTTTKTVMPAGAQQIGKNQGKGETGTDQLALFLKVFGGEVLTAFARMTKTLDKVMTRTIANGKSASFPVMGRTSARYLKQGQSLDDYRKEIKHSEKVITIDGLLTTDVLIYDIEDAMNHYDVRAEYSRQMGEAMALASDSANFAEMAKLVNSRATAKDENIEGLGRSPLVVMSDTTDPVAAGKQVLESLTMMRAAFTRNFVPAGDRTFYTSPETYSHILSTLMPNAANYAALIDPETGNIRNVMGFEVVETPLMTMAHIGGAVDKPSDAFDGVGHVFPATGETSTAGKFTVGVNNVVGLCVHRSAIAILKLRDMALERARRPEYQADQIIAKYAMGHGGLRPEAVGAVIVKTGQAAPALDVLPAAAGVREGKRAAK